ncbi:MAG: response regulator transcription factor [Alphaproteobacteria bacterium]|nr:response regulator transcription factor [Alphaproteobacteria bacterium]MBV9554154.1 response regulator transcription factor [Alphaproteobacteria bacterium]
MPVATTIVIARDDFSIPGGDIPESNGATAPDVLEHRFFSLLRESKPDVVVLDLRQANGDGVGMILKVRRQSSVPILVVCGQDKDRAQDYRFAGAAECIASPVDVVAFNEVLQQIVRVNAQAGASATREPTCFRFAEVTFRPHHNLVVGADSRTVHLTTAEGLLLAHFVANPWEIQTRAALAGALYGKHRPATDRAIDVVVNRLRTKLRSLGEATEHLIKTEFRRGYRFVCDTSVNR